MKTSTPMSKAELRFQKRKEAVAAVKRGDRPTDVARIMDLDLRTLFNWLARHRNGGEEALREGSRRGRPRKVTAKVMRWLDKAIREGDPQQYRFTFCLWTLAIVRTLLKREFGIQLSKSGVSRLLRHLGLSAQRPIYRSYQQDPKKLEKYLKRTFPQIRRLAKKLGAVIYFVDEAAVRADSHRGTTWGKKGETPIVKDSGGRFGINMISAVTPRGDMKFKTFEGKMDGARYLDFLIDLLNDTGKPIIVIADNASYHQGKFVKECAEKSNDQVTLINLPPYAPELNPDEQVWNHAKSRLGKLFIETKEQLVSEVRAILQSIQRSPDLVRSFFQMKDTKYAADAV
jgi:transposase